jgi:hypothetical protein
MPNDLSRVQLVIPEDTFEQRRFSSTVASDKSDLGVAGERAFGSVE